MADENPYRDMPRERMQAFRQRLGIPFDQFNAAVQNSISDALAAPVDPGPAGSPGSCAWTGFGARNIGGRIRCLAQDPARVTTMYAGTALGGVFRTLDAGDTWEPLGAAEHSFPVGAIAVAPSNPNIVYVGTGEHGVSHRVTGGVVVAEEFTAAGRGFFRFDLSTSPPTVVREAASQAAPDPPPAVANPPGAANCFARIVVDPADPQRCWIASGSGLWRREAGAVFHPEPVIVPAPPASTLGTVATDVLLVPHWNRNRGANDPNPHRLYVAIGGVGIFRGQFDPARPGAGTVWEPMLNNGLPVPSTTALLTWDQIRLAVCSSNPQHLYAIAEDAATQNVLGIFHSSNGGDLWAPCALPALNGQADWNLVLEVHPDNPAIVVAGAVELARSMNFGASWESLMTTSNFDQGDHAQHADQHAALFDAADPRRLWLANDGGLAMANDVVGANPHTTRGWRKRSHGIQAGQFNDIAVSTRYPAMVGGGLQDNGTYMTFGGETWHYINGGDGGQMAFEVDDPRSFVAPWQGQGAGVSPLAINRVRVISGTAVNVSGARSLVNADLAPPNDVFTTSGTDIENLIADPPHGSLFAGLVEHDPRTAGHFLVGRTNGGAYVTTDGGANYAPVGYPAALIGGGNISTMALARSGGLTADRWIGTNQSVVLRGRNPFAAPADWIDVTVAAAGRTPLAITPGDIVTRIVVHPAEDRYVAVATASTTPPHQGRVFLSLDRGEHWADITGLAAVGAPPVAAPARLALPRSPVTSLAFDPQPAAGEEQVLFAGTLAGVFVIRNLPRRRAPPANADVPAFNPRWHSFNGRGQAAEPPRPAHTLLPMTLVNDLKIIPLRRDAAAAAGSPESLARHRLAAAIYGRGMAVCDITRGYPAAIGPGGPERRLYIRQTVIEDGMSYPRPTPATLNTAPAAGGTALQFGGDPRAPAGPAPLPLRFTDRDAFDIRIDNAPFQFFDDVIDGVEFDESLRSKTLRVGELNVVYVQVHTRGWRFAGAVDVDLYFAVAPNPGDATTNAGANAPALPDLHADFWSQRTAIVLPAPAAATNPPRAVWQRAAQRELLLKLYPNQPEVARFEWVPPAALGGQFVALLALCSSTLDDLPVNPPTVMRELIRNERRAALRVVRAEPFVPDLYIRDGLDDDGRLGGVAFGGRSPDIIVVAAAPADPVVTFNDLGDDRAGDRVRGGGGNNVVYVRVHNRKDVDSAADVELFWAVPNLPVSAVPDQASPPFDQAKWKVIAAVDALNVTVPARGTKLARFDFSAAPAPEPGIPNAIAFIALIKSRDGLDPVPVRTEVDTPAKFWRLFLQLGNANNAALRALRYA